MEPTEITTCIWVPEGAVGEAVDEVVEEVVDEATDVDQDQEAELTIKIQRGNRATSSKLTPMFLSPSLSQGSSRAWPRQIQMVDIIALPVT